MVSFKDIENKTLDTSYDAGVAMSERFRKAQESVDWNDHPYLNMTDAGKASYSPVNRTFGAEQLLEVKSDAGTIAYDTFRKGVLDLASLPEKAQMSLGNTLAGISGDTLGTEMRDRAYDSLMKTMEDSRFIDSNYGDAESWTARFTGGAMSMGEMLTIGALTGPVGLGAFVGTLSLSDGALNDMANYYDEHGNLDGYETDPVNLALDYGNAVFQIGSEMIGGTGRFLNGRVLKSGSVMGAVVKETVSNFIQESLQGLAADATEVLKGNEDVNILLENAGGYVKDGIVGGVLGGVTGGTFYRVNKGRGKGSIKKVLRKLYPQKNEKELDAGAEEIWAKTEEKGLKSFVPEIMAHTEAVNDKGKIRENIRQKVAMMYEDADMSEKEKAKAIEATTTTELENILYDSIERKVPLTSHPLLQGEVNDLGWFRTGIPEHRRAEIDALNKEFAELKAQQKELMSAQQKDYAKLEEIETKIQQFQKNLPETLGDLVVADREQVNQMLKAQRNRVGQIMQKKQVLQSIKERARKSAEKQDKADTKLAEQIATGAEKAKEQRVKAETAQQTKEAKARTLTEQREISSSIKGLKTAISERKRLQNLELKYAIGQATDESLRNVLKNRKFNAFTVDNMKRRDLIAAVKQIPNLSMVELMLMSRKDISYQQEMAESKQEKAKTAKGFFHRKINRDFANESGILQAWGYSKDDSAINLVFIKDGGFKDWDEIVMELQDNGYLPQSYARTYEETDALVEQAKDIVLNNKQLDDAQAGLTQGMIDYTADMGEMLLSEAGYTPEQIRAMSFQEMSDKLAELYKTETEQLTEEQAAQIPDDMMFQDEVFKVADENARLDDIYPEYKGETIRIIDPVELKQAQFEIVQETNPMQDDYHVGIRSVDDIKTFAETINDEESFVWGDYSREDAKRDLAKNEITVYSSYPIENGVFVSTSYRQAEEYAGGKGSKVYERTVPLDFVAWINGDEGQFAMTDIIGKKRTVYNSNGDRIAKSEPALRNFWAWFGDSKVVDDQGRPLIVYHGTSSDFDTFDIDQSGKNTGTAIYGKGFYFTTNKDVATKWGQKRGVPIVMSAYVKLENPNMVEELSYPKDSQEKGFDGVIAKVWGEKDLEIVAFESNQIKSTDNKGTFSEDTGNIYRQTRVSGKGKDAFRGAFVPEYRFIARTQNLDASTLAHELAHDWGQENFRWARSGQASEEFMRSWGAVEKAIGITDKDIYFTYDASEKFARAYEGWLLERKDWADILHINTDEEKKAVEEAMEDYRKELVDIYESVSNPYFTMTWGKVGELKPELKAWFERSTKYDLLDSQVARGEITEEQAGEEKLKDVLESAVNSSVDGMTAQDRQAVDTIDKLEQLKDQEKRFEAKGGNRNRLQRRLDAISLAQNMVANNAVLGKYDTHRDMLAVAEAADIFVNTRLNDALAIINGKMPEQDGLYASDLYTALERKAKTDNDFGLIEELRNSLIANQLAKELGQRVAGFRNYTGNGDLDIMSVYKSLDKIFEKAYSDKEREQLEADIKDYFESVALADSQLDLDSFFNELECK